MRNEMKKSVYRIPAGLGEDIMTACAVRASSWRWKTNSAHKGFGGMRPIMAERIFSLSDYRSEHSAPGN